jgi:hypothetical protein
MDALRPRWDASVDRQVGKEARVHEDWMFGGWRRHKRAGLEVLEGQYSLCPGRSRLWRGVSSGRENPARGA